MALGKAFVEVHADTKPFAREVGPEIEAALKKSEGSVRKSSSKLGETVSEETGKGIQKNRKKVGEGIDKTLNGTLGQGLFKKFAKGIVDSIDDGLSGLPAELKIALGVGLVALLPFAIALGSAIATGIIAGLTIIGGFALGALLASQFEEVQTAAQDTFSFIREQFLESAQPLVRPFLNGLELVRSRLSDLQPELSSLFARIGDTIVPVIDGVLLLVEGFIPAFKRGFANIGAFLAPFQIGLARIGEALGYMFETLLNNKTAPEALYDLLIFVEDLVVIFTHLVEIGLDFYGTLRNIFETLGIVEEYGTEIQVLGKKFGIAAEEDSLLGKAIRGTTTSMEYQEKVLTDLNTALDAYIKEQFEAIGLRLDFQQGLDDLTASVDKNGTSLKENKQAGRDNARQLLELAQIALETRANNIEMGKGLEYSQGKFLEQKASVFALAKELGLSETATKNLIGSLLELPPPVPTGITQGSLDRLIAGAKWANTLATRIAKLIALGAASVVTNAAKGATPHSEGGVFTTPHVGLVAEAGPEAIIPLNNPGRAAQVMNEAGLGASMTPQVNVYIGNQQVDAYIATQVTQQMTAAARSVSYGTRGI